LQDGLRRRVAFGAPVRRLAEKQDQFAADREAREQNDYMVRMQVPLIGLQIEQHEHAQVQDENGARIDDDLDGKQEFGVQKHEQPGDMQQQREERQTAMDGVAKRDREHAGRDAD